MRLNGPLLLARRFLSSPGSSPFYRIRGAVLGVGLSLVPLIVVIHVAGGMIEGITRRFIEAGTYHIQVTPRDDEAEGIEGLAKELASLDGVVHAEVERTGLALLNSESGRTGAAVRAVDPDIWQQDLRFRSYVSVTDGVFDLAGGDSIVLGREVASELDLAVGDEARLVTFRALPGGGYLPRVSRFTVSGIVSTGYQDLDRLWVFISYQRGRRILAPGSSREFIGFKIEHPFGLPNALFGESGLLNMSGGVSASDRAAARELYREIRTRTGGNYWVRSWFDVERSRYMSFRTTKNLLSFIMLLIVLVATVNISATLVMMVLEKRSEIAILKSTGTSPQGIQLIFVIGGFLTGVAGALLGIVVGIVVTMHVNEILLFFESAVNALLGLGQALGGSASTSFEIFNADFYLETIPIRLQYGDLFLVATATIGLSTLVSLFPARRAAGIRPLDVLQKH
jgi:lipoprotein-releasing system permease protein